MDPLDDDIQNMKKKDLVAALKSFKDDGVNVKTTGNVADLKARLQATRNTQQQQTLGAGAGTGAATSTAASAAAGAGGTEEATGGIMDGAPKGTATGAKLESTMLRYDGVHPISETCLRKLGQHEAKFILVVTDQDIIDRLTPHLQPVEELVDTVIEVVHGWAELNSSAAINYAALAKALRARCPFVVARREVKLLFEVFGIEVKPGAMEGVTTATSAADTDLEAGTGASLDAFQAEIQARHRQDMIEAGQDPDSNRGTTARADASEGGATQGDDVQTSGGDNQASAVAEGEGEEDAALRTEVAIIQEAMRGFLRDWMTTFPRPDVPIWPQDFTSSEQVAVKKFVREYIRDEDNDIDLDARKQPVAVTEAAVQAMLASDDFPAVEGARTETVVTSVFRFECNNIYNTRLRTNKKAAQKAQQAQNAEGSDDGSEVDDIADDQGQDKSNPAGKKGKKRKHKSSSPLPEDDAPGKSGLLGNTCIPCFFAGNDCSLRGRNEPGRACTFCWQNKHQCRVACEECAAVAISAGRGSNDASMLVADCAQCEYRE